MRIGVFSVMHFHSRDFWEKFRSRLAPAVGGLGQNPDFSQQQNLGQNSVLFLSLSTAMKTWWQNWRQRNKFTGSRFWFQVFPLSRLLMFHNCWSPCCWSCSGGERVAYRRVCSRCLFWDNCMKHRPQSRCLCAMSSRRCWARLFYMWLLPLCDGSNCWTCVSSSLM